MTNDLPTLANLRDIVEPEGVTFWPPAPGIWALFIVTMLVVIFFGFRAFKNWKANEYRRVALIELEAATTATAIANILRRTALAAYPRDVIVPLQGSTWVQWLEIEGGFQMPTAAKTELGGVYSDSKTEAKALQLFTREWISKHAGV